MRNAEIQADRLGMADMQVTIRLRWETREFAVLSGLQIFRHDVADEVGRSSLFQSSS